MFVYHFVDPDLSAETFFKYEGATEKGGVNRELSNFSTIVLGFTAEPVCIFFFFFLVTKKGWSLKVLLACTFILDY